MTIGRTIGSTTRRFAFATAVATFVLLLVGGLVNPTGSSLACPDWPLCHGSAFPEMTGGVLYEHTHRLVATGVGVMTLVLGALLWRDGRRGLGVGIVAMVVLQGVLGGLTVIYKLPMPITMSHLGLSMIFFVTLLYIAAGGPARERTLELSPGKTRLAVVAAGAIWLQIVLGGIVRHSGSAMACADEIPLCFGQLWPAGALNAQIHMGHRMFGIVAGLIAITAAVSVARKARWAWVIPVLVLVQIGLGVLNVLTMAHLHVIETHLAVAVLLLGTTTWLALRARPAAADAVPSARPLVAERAR